MSIYAEQKAPEDACSGDIDFWRIVTRHCMTRYSRELTSKHYTTPVHSGFNLTRPESTSATKMS